MQARLSHLIFALALAILSTPLCLRAQTTTATTGAGTTIEMTKDEALSLMRAQFTIALLENSLGDMNTRQQDLLRNLYAKNDLKQDLHIFDIGIGAFVQRAALELKKAGKPVPAELAKTTDVPKDDALPVINLQFTIENTAGQLKQAYAEREKVLRAIHEAHKAPLDKYAADWMNGRLIPAKTPEPAAKTVPATP